MQSDSWQFQISKILGNSESKNFMSFLDYNQFRLTLTKRVIARKFKKTVSNDCATVNLHAVEKAR